MIATKLVGLGISDTLAKSIIVLVLAAVSGALMALVQSGQLTGVVATIAPYISGLITGIAALIDPNATHAPQ